MASAVSAPQDLYLYGDEDIDIYDLAACYCHRMARNHPFVDASEKEAQAYEADLLHILKTRKMIALCQHFFIRSSRIWEY